MHWASNTQGSQPKGALELPPPQGPAVEGAPDETNEQFEAVLAAALSLAHLVGGPEDPIVITISGYVYPGHTPPAGEPNEVIGITIAARPEERISPETQEIGTNEVLG